MSTRHPVPAECARQAHRDPRQDGLRQVQPREDRSPRTCWPGASGSASSIPTGTWWGLRLMADGNTPSGHPIVIFGGQHADLPIGAAHGAAIARAIGTSSTPAIIDTRELTVSDRTRFFTGFAETLVRANRGELTLILDEAHLFMPQAGARVGGGAPAMLHAGNNLVSLGRGVGLRIVLISQRPAKLHKDSLTQVETLVAMRLIAPQDRNAIDDWIGEWADAQDGRDLARSLPSLPTGDAWIWSPEMDHLERAHCPLAATYDSGHARTRESLDLAGDRRGGDRGAPRGGRRRGAGRRSQGAAPPDLGAGTGAAQEDVCGRGRGELRRRLEAALVPVHEDYARAACRRPTGRSPVSPARSGRLPGSSRKHGRRSRISRRRRNRNPSRRSRRGSAPRLAPRRYRPPRRGSRVRSSGSWTPSPGWRAWASPSAPAASRRRFWPGTSPAAAPSTTPSARSGSAGLIEYPSSGEIALTDEGRAHAREADMPLTTDALQARGHEPAQRASAPGPAAGDRRLAGRAERRGAGGR